jgi:pimeloyl-ACP methyl ester carboxylesterase
MKIILRITSALLLLTAIVLIGAWLYFDAEHTRLNAETRAQFDETFIDLPAGTVHYQLGGPENGEVVVLVHGFSVPAYLWDPTFAALTQAGYRVLRFDLYGRGHSDRPDVDYTIAFFADQLEQLTKTLLPDSSFNLVGLSMGGPVVTFFTNQHPQRVNRLALVDPMVFPLPQEAVSLLSKPFIGEYLANVYMIPQLAAGQINDFRQKDRYPDWGDRFREQMQYDGFRRAILSTIRHLPAADTLGEYAKLGQKNIPVQLYWGRQDQTIPLEHSEKVMELVPQARLSIIEEAGHIAHFERPDVFNPLLLEFLQQPTQ